MDAADPPFPDDVPTAPLLRISLAKLQARDGEEVQRFTSACEELGFFYLDLRGAGDALLAQADELFGVGRELFGLPPDEKAKYTFKQEKNFLGYKPVGGAVADKHGNPDRNEFYNIGKDDIMGHGHKWPAPGVLERRRDLLRGFMQSAYGIVSLVLDLLNDHLGLPAGTLRSLHRLEGRSGDQVRWIRAPPPPLAPPEDEGKDESKDESKNKDKGDGVALGEHTDFGSVSVLFNRLGGLQVLPPGAGAAWCYVRPLPGHAVINLGDAMAKFTNGLLRSNMHRVVSPPGAQARCTRYSLVYFNRPEDHVVLGRLQGGRRIPPLAPGVVEDAVTSEEWIRRRVTGFRPAVQVEGAVSQRAR